MKTQQDKKDSLSKMDVDKQFRELYFWIRHAVITYDEFRDLLNHIQTAWSDSENW